MSAPIVTVLMGVIVGYLMDAKEFVAIAEW